MRVGVLTAIGIATSIAAAARSTASAEPRFDASGFVGVGYFSEDTELGNSFAPEQVPSTSAVLGGRLGWTAFPTLIDTGDTRIQLGIEAELSLAPAFTSEAEGRMSYFAPVFGWRAHLIARLVGLRNVVTHLVVGGGGETIASSSPFMAKETDPVVYWGLGAATPISDRWQLRLDLRHGIMPGRVEATSSTLALQFGVAATFGLPKRRVPRPEPETRPATATLDDRDRDGDGDGLPDRLDRCPRERETVNGLDDGDGCAEPDPDGDGVIGAADSCPAVREDVDGFGDADGCPDADNDGDGLADGRDRCPLAAETTNGLTDQDGCPDQVPASVVKALAAAGAIRFEAKRARVTPAAKRALRPLLAALRENPALRISIIGFQNKPGDGDLAKRRAEAVKWHLIDLGVMEDRIETRIAEVSARAIEVRLR